MDKYKNQIEEIKQSGLFDEAYYLKNNPDVKKNPIEHYLMFGAKEKRDPSVYFNTNFYLEKNKDVARTDFNPLIHYIRHGYKENRLPLPFSKSGIIIVYHIAVMGKYMEVVKEQLNLLAKSGLGHKADKIHITVVGEKDPELAKLLEKSIMLNKMKITHYDDLGIWELPSIKKVQEVAKQNPKTKICYFHTKGVSYYRYQGWEQKNINAWRRYMEYFNLEKWQECVKALDEYDCCGVEWMRTWVKLPHYFAGNFWWATGEYINRCELKYFVKEDKPDRCDAEFFIGSGNPKAKNFLNAWENSIFQSHFNDEELEKRKQVNPKDWLTPRYRWREYYYEDFYYRK